MKTKTKVIVNKTLHLIVDSVAYILIFYMLICCEFAFRSNKLIFTVFSTLKFIVFSKYCYTIYKASFNACRTKPSKIFFISSLCIIIFLLSYAIVGLLATTFGYLDIAPVLKEVAQ